MRFVADESVDAPIVWRLRETGHDIWFVAEARPGAPDEAVLRHANEAGVPLITADRDFGDLVIRLRLPSRGVLFLRIGMLSSDEQAKVVVDAVAEYGNQLLDEFVVVEPNRVRFKTKPETS